MYVQFVLWDLTASPTSVRELRGYLRDYAVEAYASVTGMRLKIWVSDAERQLWGAVYLWDDPRHIAGIFGVSRVIDVIGYPPTSVGGFAVEGIAEGVSVHGVLQGLGLAMESPTDT